VKTIQNMFEHLHWANQRILETLKSIEGENKQAIILFSHILLAEQVWFTRLKGLDSSKLPIWAEVSSDLEQTVSYRNSKGIEFKNSVRDILTHAALHGQYHRGQINQLLRINDFEPVNVDFITFRR
jgi:uncharacterized damage-inducible protein DinB